MSSRRLEAKQIQLSCITEAVELVHCQQLDGLMARAKSDMTEDALEMFKAIAQGKCNNEDGFKGAIATLHVKIEREKVLWMRKGCTKK